MQIKDAVSRKPGSTLKVDDVVDDTLVLELEKEGFISCIYQIRGRLTALASRFPS